MQFVTENHKRNKEKKKSKRGKLKERRVGVIFIVISS